MSNTEDNQPFRTLKPYNSIAHEIEKYISESGREASKECRNLGWIALGGRGMASREEVADRLESIARNADALAEQVRELEDPREQHGDQE